MYLRASRKDSSFAINRVASDRVSLLGVGAVDFLSVEGPLRPMASIASQYSPPVKELGVQSTIFGEWLLWMQLYRRPCSMGPRLSRKYFKVILSAYQPQ